MNYLKDIKGNIHADTSLLDVFNSQLSVAGSNIIFLRLKFLKEIQKIAMGKHLQIAENEILTTV